MAMSLEDLLAEEGFKGRRSKTMNRASSGPVTGRIPIYPVQDELRAGTSTRLRKTERAYSDARRYDVNVESPIATRLKGRRSVDIVRREKVGGSRKDTRERHIRTVSHDMQDVIGSSIDSSKEFSVDEIVEVKEGLERVKGGVQNKGRYKDIYLNGVYSPPISKNKLKNGTGEQDKYKNITGKDVQMDNGYTNNYYKHVLGGASLKDNYQRSVKQHGSSSSRSNRSTQNKEHIRDSRDHRAVDMEQSVDELALDEVAIKAMISILTGYIRRFLIDQDFRTSLHRNCFDALKFSELDEGVIAESKVISNLDQAIETVERAAEEHANAKGLKKASLQLSVITGLNANDLKDGFTSGIPNSMLSACGHLYLSVIYLLQKKERIAAKHLLQVFCDAPLPARTTLLPELWENVFYPHLSHLEVWYNQEAESLADNSRNRRKLKQVTKVYNEIVDTGTYQFALYYKDWLTDGVEAPLIPSIHVPSVSVNGIRLSNGHSLDFSSSSNSFSPKPMVSKKLYDSVFGHMLKPSTVEVEEYKSAHQSDDGMRSSDESVVEDKRTLTYSLGEDECNIVDINRDREPHQQDGLVPQESLACYRANALGKFQNPIQCQEGYETNMLQALPIAKVNELTLKKLANSVFELHQTERSIELIGTTQLQHFDDAPYPSLSSVGTGPLVEDLHEKDVDGVQGRFSLNIPQDYICPLTKLLFEDPVTLETGQTYERVAIGDWFSKGNITCPVTGKTLECRTLPLTNFILNRVIDSWKLEHAKNILAYATQTTGSPCTQKYKDEAAIFILEQLFTGFGPSEDKTNAKHFITLGGLNFLLQRFGYGDLDEKTRVAGLFCFCIKADSSCRNHVAINIEKQGLLQLLHCKRVKSRANAVLLLFELICLNRRKDALFFFSGLPKEGIVSSMHILLVFLQTCPPDQRPLVAVLLLHLDLMVDHQKYSVYREEAVDTITSSLDSSLSNEKARETCCRVLLILGGRISFSGKVMTEDWILKKAGFLDSPESEVQEDEETLKEDISSDIKEEEAIVDWLMTLAASLLGDGKKSFLNSLSQCLSSGHRDLMRVCFTTVAWLTTSLASLPDLESHLPAFSVLISKLKENLKNGEWVEHKILAVMSLLNFSKIPECKALLMTIADEIAIPLMNLSEVTWIAKELHALISQHHQ